MLVHDIPSGNLRPLPRLKERWIAQSEAIAPVERVRGETGKQLSIHFISHVYPPDPKVLVYLKDVLKVGNGIVITNNT